jgi:hypothetical protein
VATFSSVTRQHLLQAIAEHDTRGADDFHALYGFPHAAGYTLLHEGRRYDALAVLGVAHRYATGRLATPDEVGADAAGAGALLRRRGFDVTVPAAAPRRTPPARTATPRRATTPRAPARRSPTAERPLVICPTCFVALPATGVCGTCG